MVVALEAVLSINEGLPSLIGAGQNGKDYDSVHRELLNLEHRYALLQ